MKTNIDTIGRINQYWTLPSDCTQEEIDAFDPLPEWLIIENQNKNQNKNQKNFKHKKYESIITN